MYEKFGKEITKRFPPAFLFVFAIGVLIIASYLFLANISLEQNLSHTQYQLDNSNLQVADLADKLNGTRQNLEQSEQELSAAHLELENLTRALNMTNGELEQKSEDLAKTQEELDAANADIEQKNTLITETKSELLSIQGGLTTISSAINSTIQWFKDNSVMPENEGFAFMNYIDTYCVTNSKVNLGCIDSVLKDKEGVDYITETNYNRLYSLKEIIGRKGGNCEDYSLLLKAIVNTIKMRGKDLDLESWDTSSTGQYVLYNEGDSYYYYPGATGKRLGSILDLNPYMICYNVDESSGHCIIALSPTSINSTADVGSLDGAETFEPQTGQYLGKIGENYSICAGGQIGCDQSLYSIYFVISDDDLYIFSQGEWTSYAFYSDKAQALEEKIADKLKQDFGS